MISAMDMPAPSPLAASDAMTLMVEQETVRAIINAYAEGRIELPVVKRKNGTGGDIRYALAQPQLSQT